MPFYATQFNTVEINTSFYRPPTHAFIAKWMADVPDDFRFCFKVWRGITHDKKLEDCSLDVKGFLQALAPARSKCGPLLFQLPPSLGIEALDSLDLILAQGEMEGWQAAVEFRNNSWYAPETIDMLRRHNAALVRHDFPGHATPVLPLEEKIIYMRFHGAGVKYGDDYGENFIEKLVARLYTVKNRRAEAYIFFNNTMGAAVRNAAQLNCLLADGAA